jgi:hypothetical protein
MTPESVLESVLAQILATESDDLYELDRLSEVAEVILAAIHALDAYREGNR